MAVTVATFRVDLPEFKNKSFYPDAAVTFWLALAAKSMNQDRWGAPAATGDPLELYDLGQEMFAAHRLVIERKAQDDAVNGTPPGMASGPVNNQSVDKVSLGFDVQAALEEGGGYWNLTIYGQRFYRMLQMMGAGPVQVGVGGLIDPLSSANAFTGLPLGIPGFPQ